MDNDNDRQEAVRDFREHPTVVPLEGKVQHYDWGGLHFIPDLLGRENPEGKPYAELWIGAHPSAPSEAAVFGERIPLDRLQEAAPEALLGPGVARRFGGRLPYLYKVLDARKMLSIQAHPTKRQAEEGFRRENEAGIDPKAPDRNYKDDNHKPEVHVALTEFWMLHGFRPLEDIVDGTDPGIEDGAPELTALMPDLPERVASAGNDRAQHAAILRALYERAMTMPQDEVDAILEKMLARIHDNGEPDKGSPDYWALRAFEEFPLPGGHYDRGIFSIYLLNLVHLRPGQGTYQPAGCLHAYLEGVNMELMANSDNVLRGGLTPKHVDVPELMRTLVFDSGRPEILEGEAVSETETVYRTPAEEFALSRITLGPGRRFQQDAGHGPDSLIVLEGEATISSQGVHFDLPRGRIAMAPDAAPYSLSSREGAVVYRASVPLS